MRKTVRDNGDGTISEIWDDRVKAATFTFTYQDDRGDRDGGFIFDVPSGLERWAGLARMNGHPTLDRQMDPDDVFAHLGVDR